MGDLILQHVLEGVRVVGVWDFWVVMLEKEVD